MSLIKIDVGCYYTRISDSSSVEVLQFKDFDLDDDSYQKDIQTVVYINEYSDVCSMELNQFSMEHR